METTKQNTSLQMTKTSSSEWSTVKIKFNYDGIAKALFESELCSTEQTDDNKGEEDYGSYWLNDCTVEDVIDFLKQTLGEIKINQ